jgi:type IV pilus assembly protein PilC
MAEFVCKVADARGRVFEQVETADTESELRQRLLGQGFFVHSVRARGWASLTRALPQQRRRRISSGDFVLFNQQFLTLFRAGLPILRSLELLAERAARPRLRRILDQVRERVRGGMALSEALREQAVFPEVYVTSVLAGERSGNLGGVLEQYLAYQKVTGGVRRRLLTALVYPSLLLVVSAGVLSGAVLYIIPKFDALYREMNVELPALTRGVVTFALHIRASLLVAVLVAAGLGIGLVLFGRREAGARVLDRLRMDLPIIGEVFLKFRLTQFARTLSTLLAGGIPLVPSLETAGGAMESPVLRHALKIATQRVREGQALHAALGQTGVMPSLVTEMIEVGEATGALPHMLDSVAEFYEEDLNARLATLLALVEPLLLIGVAGTVLVILVALYLPIFSAGTLAR